MIVMNGGDDNDDEVWKAFENRWWSDAMLLNKASYFAPLTLRSSRDQLLLLFVFTFLSLLWYY